MKKTYLISVVLGVTGFLVAEARTLTPDEALGRLARTGGPAKAASRAASSPVLVRSVIADDGEASVYAFESAKGGYLIVSADDTAEPLLGYSDCGTISGDSIPEPLEWWLSEYSRQIAYARENSTGGGSISFPLSVAGREVVAPLIKTSWDQGAPYNAQCPIYDGERTWTGCVATAMAQVMNYWQYPEKGQGSISFDSESIGKRLSLNFSLKKFDWANMADHYTAGQYTDDQAAAVAYLMKACGYSVKMDYGLDASGALAMNIRKALIKYFNYDKNISHELRQLYTATEWSDLIYKSVSEGCPVLYGGGSMIGGGHSFICDGYDGEGYFHFNWGWTGMSDGYFLLDALNPYALGAGGGGGGGFNFTQDAVVGVRPPTGEPEVVKPLTLVQTGSLAAYERNDSICFDLFAENGPMWVNYNPENIKVILGTIIEKVGDDTFEKIGVNIAPVTFTLDPGYGTGPMYFTPRVAKSDLDLQDGTYRFTIGVCHEGTSEYIPVKANRGYSNYVTIKKAGTNYTIVNEDVYRLEVKEANVLEELYYGMATKVGITVTNDSDIEMTRGFAPVLLANGTVAMLGESVYVTVKPGETVYREWVTPLYQLQQYFQVAEDMKVTFTLFDESTYNMWSEDVMKSVTLHPNPGQPDIVNLKAPTISGSTTNPDRSVTVSDPSNMVVKCMMSLNSGVFGYELLAFIVNPDMSIEKTSGEIMFMTGPKTLTFTTTMSFPNAEPNREYILMMGYSMGGQYVQIGPNSTRFRVADNSGVENVASDGRVAWNGTDITATGAEIEVFDLSGIKVLGGCDVVSTDCLASGIYIVRAGNETIKISK